VIVAYENQIAMEETLEASLARIFGTALRPEPAPVSTVSPEKEKTAPRLVPSLIQEAAAVYERALQAQRAGDWAKYGEEIRRLGAILQELSKSREEVPKAP